MVWYFSDTRVHINLVCFQLVGGMLKVFGVLQLTSMRYNINYEYLHSSAQNIRTFSLLYANTVYTQLEMK